MSETTTAGDVLAIETKGEVQTVTLNRPDRLNALNQPMSEALLAHFESLRRNTATEVVVANLYLLGGTRQLTPATAGIEAMVLAASERGTKRFPGAAVRQHTARLGSTIGIEANDDWSAIGLHAIRSTFDNR